MITHIITSGHIDSFRVHLDIHLDIHLEIPRVILIFLREWTEDLDITGYDTSITGYDTSITGCDIGITGCDIDTTGRDTDIIRYDIESQGIQPRSWNYNSDPNK